MKNTQNTKWTRYDKGKLDKGNLLMMKIIRNKERADKYRDERAKSNNNKDWHKWDELVSINKKAAQHWQKQFDEL